MTKKQRKENNFNRIGIFDNVHSQENKSEKKEIPDLSKKKNINLKEDLDIGKNSLELDTLLIETLRKRHNLVEEHKKVAFSWKKSLHKKLKNLSNDTEIDMEDYLSRWCEEGLLKELKKVYNKM